MSPLPRSTLTWLIPVLAFSALTVGVWSGYKTLKRGPTQPLFSTESATVINTPRPLKAFSLTDHSNNRFSQDELKDHWTLMAFGYTSCPDICPTMLATLSQTSDLLEQQAEIEGIQFVFVSVDPERDSLEQLAKYVSYFNPGFIGVTGPQAALKKLTEQFGILYRKVEETSSSIGYLVDHSASFILINPKGRLQAVFGAPHDATSIAKDLRLIIQNYKS